MVSNHERIYEEIKRLVGRKASEVGARVSEKDLLATTMKIVEFVEHHRIKPRNINKDIKSAVERLVYLTDGGV